MQRIILFWSIPDTTFHIFDGVDLLLQKFYGFFTRHFSVLLRIDQFNSLTNSCFMCFDFEENLLALIWTI